MKLGEIYNEPFLYKGKAYFRGISNSNGVEGIATGDHWNRYFLPDTEVQPLELCPKGAMAALQDLASDGVTGAVCGEHHDSCAPDRPCPTCAALAKLSDLLKQAEAMR